MGVPHGHSVGSEQFVNFPMSEIDQRKRSAAGTGKMMVEWQSETVEDGRDDVRRDDGTFGRNTPDRVTGAHDPSALDTAPGEVHGKALRPVIPSSGRIDFGGTAEFRDVAHECRIQQASLMKVFDQCGISLIVHGSDDVLHSGD